MTAVQSLLVLAAVAAVSFPAVADDADARSAAFLNKYCVECHQGDTAESKLDLATLNRAITDRDIESRWVRIHDRIEGGEMPPKDSPRPSPSEQSEFLGALAQKLTKFREVDDRENGRVRGRRLTRRQLGVTLQELLGIDIQLMNLLTEESPSDQFSTVADRQTISHFHLEDHLRRSTGPWMRLFFACCRETMKCCGTCRPRRWRGATPIAGAANRKCETGSRRSGHPA